MVIKNVSLETVIGVTSKIPDNQLPEIAFAGKSNVGKSSLINALMNRKSLARTSAQPGKTQTINFYNINVDLPGYGYAKVSQQEKEKWGKMIEKYLHRSKVLQAVFLLVDIRHEPSANDRQMYEWILANGYHPIVIATKLDKINRSQIAKQVKLVKQGLGVDKDTIVIPFSAETKQGREEIYDLIDQLTGKEEVTQ